MHTAYSVIFLMIYLAASALALRHYIHIFQLNSYKPNVQLKWLRARQNGGWLYFLIFAVGIFAGSMLFEAPAVAALLYTAELLVLAVCSRPRPAKIPLKYTARVKRLIATLTVIYIAVPVVLWLTADLYLLPICTVLAVLSPFIVLLANLLNRPLEQAINRHYINDAKRILRECPELTVIGITGSFGKTSVKYFLDELLSVKFNVLKTPGNFNTPLGVVKTIRGELRATHDIFLCEMGAKNVGDIKEICDIVHPAHGIITSVGPMHLESFHTIENVRKTKFELADSLPENGLLFLNMDNDNVREGAGKRRFIGYGIDSREGYYIENLSVTSSGSEFEVVTPEGERCSFKTKLIGRHNAINICGAIAAAHTLGIPLSDLKPAVRRLESVPHRLELRKNGDITFIDDAYNSNPSGAAAALEALAMMDGYRILCTPGMIELGAMEDKLNREFGEKAASCCDFAALVGKHQTAAIAEGLRAAGFPEERIFVADDLNSALSHIYTLTSEGKKKIILLENDLPDNYKG